MFVIKGKFSKNIKPVKRHKSQLEGPLSGQRKNKHLKKSNPLIDPIEISRLGSIGIYVNPERRQTRSAL